jgi:hypothetical protein
MFLLLHTIFPNRVQRHAAGGSPCGLFNRELGFCVVAQKAEFGHFFAKLTYKFKIRRSGYNTLLIPFVIEAKDELRQISNVVRLTRNDNFIEL